MAMAHQSTLRTRITIYAAIGSIIVFTVGAVLLYQDLTHQLSRSIDVSLRVRLDDLESAFAGGATLESSDGVSAQLLRADGTVVWPAGTKALLTGPELARAANHHITVERAVPGIGVDTRLAAVPLDGTGLPGPMIGVVTASTRPLLLARSHLARVLATTGPGLAIAVAFAAWLLAGVILSPVRRMAREAASISLAQTGQRLADPKGRDELAELGTTLNEMLTRIERAVAHERSFIDNAAHELRTPLAVLRGELELASLEAGDEVAVRASLVSALEEADRLARLTTDLLTLARADAGELDPQLVICDLEIAVREIIDHLPSRAGISLEVEGRSTVAFVEPAWIIQILSNLVANANRYAAYRIQISLRNEEDRAIVVVADDGPGFPDALLPQVFDRFTQGSEARTRAGSDAGSGLGLAITASLVRAQGGSIEASNGPPLGGAAVTIALPAGPGSSTSQRSGLSE